MNDASQATSDSDDYSNGYAQFARMVGDENIGRLAERLRAVCPDFAREVFTVVGGRVWTRGGIDLKTRSLCSISVLGEVLNEDRAGEASSA